MAEQDFREFVERKIKEAQPAEAIDWARRRADWLGSLEKLYGDMGKSLEPFGQKIRIEHAPIQLKEDYLGTYATEKLTFTIGHDKIEAKPIGTLLIGAKGRVDLSGPRKTLRIVLLGKDGPALTIQTENGGMTEESSRFMVQGEMKDAGWYIATTPPDTTVVPFNRESFLDAIMEVSGG